VQTAQFDQKVHLVAQPAHSDPRADHYATLFALANGLVGIKGSIDECASAPDTILANAYVTRPISYHEAFPGYADATETNMYASIDALADKLDRCVKKHKEKAADHHAEDVIKARLSN